MNHAWWYHSISPNSLRIPTAAWRFRHSEAPGWGAHHQCEPLKSSQVGSRMQHVWNHQPIILTQKQSVLFPNYLKWIIHDATHSYHLCWNFWNQQPLQSGHADFCTWTVKPPTSRCSKNRCPWCPRGWPPGQRGCWCVSGPSKKAGQRETVPRLSKLSPGYLHMFRAIVTIQDSSWLSTDADLVCRQQQLGVDLNLWEIAIGSAAELKFGTSQHEGLQHPKVSILGQDIPSWIRPNSL